MQKIANKMPPESAYYWGPVRLLHKTGFLGYGQNKKKRPDWVNDTAGPNVINMHVHNKLILEKTSLNKRMTDSKNW